eukprot:CAMPEP_0178403026 /NCGR_PEP_ID=MMETSP0689_2-20121128/17155_1 /TAXON_ID=160604 /ORGANISM="Amphidinium massartii, Strain CS-259" /LENGTH=225 /DNA_ID=CAMNT_0020023965 /DNA_START=103 /DNA_END=776 /DNA_ORIENTATION=+
MAPAQSTPAKVVLGTMACGLSASFLGQSFVGSSNPALRSSQQQQQSYAESRVQASSTTFATGQMALAAVGLASTGAVALASSKTRAVQRSSTVARMAYDASKEIGACDPLLLWDPIGFCTEGCTKEDFDRRRAVELKHGRICMFATIGMVWPDIFGKWDGDLSYSLGLKFSDIPSGLGAITAVPIAGWVQILFFAGLIETQLFKDPSLGGFGVGAAGAEPGNFGT